MQYTHTQATVQTLAIAVVVPMFCAKSVAIFNHLLKFRQQFAVICSLFVWITNVFGSGDNLRVFTRKRKFLYESNQLCVVKIIKLKLNHRRIDGSLFLAI